MNTSVLSEEDFKERLHQKWAVWRQQKRIYHDWLMWWEDIKTNSYFPYSGRVRTSAGLREDGEFPL